jgi:hypothetical protein
MKAGYTYITVILFLIMVMACEVPDNPIYDSSHPDPNPPGTPAATITGINPSEGFFDEIVTINGSGFNPTPEENLVQIGQGAGTVITASATELTVSLPVKSGITVPCRVAPTGAIDWSNSIDFTYKPAVIVRAEGLNWPMGVEADDEGNVYVGSASDEKIYKFDSDGNQSTFAEVPVWGAMRWGPEGYLYVAAANEGQIIRVSPDGGTVEVYVDGTGSVTDFDWAENGNLYILRTWGEGIAMYKDNVVTDLVSGDDMDPKAGRVVGDYLYVSSGWEWAFRKYPITADGLGDGEIVFWDGVLGVEADINGNVMYTIVDTYTLFSMAPDGSTESLFEDALIDNAESHLRYIRYHGKSVYAVHPGWSGDGEGSVKQIYLAVEQAPNWGLE